MTYNLKLYDKTLLSFEIQRKELGELKYHIVNIAEDSNSLLPVGFEVSDDGIAKFLSSRVIPKNREFVDQILSKSGLSINDTMGIINICKGLSLNDSYWVVESGFDGKFADYNLYENSFSQTLALIAYTGYGSNTRKGFTSSPEYTTNGMLKKCWRRMNGKIYLYKGGTSGGANTGKEPFSEFYAAQIAHTMGLNYIDYNLSKWKGTLCSTCELFTSKDVSYVPVYKFVNKSSLMEVANFLKGLGEDYYNQFVDMLIFDALIYNTDRHFGNFGLLVDSHTNQIIGMAPIFDNGMSLFNLAMDDDLQHIEIYAKTRLPAYDGVTYEEIVRQFITERQREELRRMINFKFKKHSRYNLPDSRLKILEKFLQKRVQQLLTLKEVY